jgi:hypothetical protein
MTRHARSTWLAAVGAIALAISVGTPGDGASAQSPRGKEEIPFDEASVFFELNDTDGDLGIHALVDGDAWKFLGIRDTKGRPMLGVSVKGILKKQGLTELSQVMPAPPGNILLSGVPAAENCDVVPLPAVAAPVVIDWDPVVSSHPELGETGAVVVEKYQLVVEREDELLILSVDLPSDVTSFEVPEDFTDLGEEFKFEIIVRAETGNQTAVESCFELL